MAGPTGATDGVGMGPEGDRVERAGVGDLACLVDRGDESGRDLLAHRQEFGVWVPRAVPQGQGAVEFLDVDLLADLAYADHVGRVVPLTLGATDSP